MSSTPHPPFFVSDVDALVATEHTRGPWSHEHQHAGRRAAVVRARLFSTSPSGEVLGLDARIGCVRVAEVSSPRLVRAAAPPRPDSCAPFTFSFFPWQVGYRVHDTDASDRRPVIADLRR